ncbi:MAG: nodulation protein NfeD [Anaerolineae bacterium]|jgi:membrane-bound serine protease (ClpP class)
MNDFSHVSKNSPIRQLARLLTLVLLLFAMQLAPAAGQESSVVYVLTFDGPVNPVLVSYIERAIDQAVQHDAQAIILRLDTPGGQLDLTQDIVKLLRASPTPVIVYVWPTGAMAGSAGAFITLAGHAAAMTPGSSIGAASPVTGEGEDLGETMQQKVTNILAADMENLAARRGEMAVEWARQAVTEARAATAEQALALNVIDVIANDVDDLLRQLDGFTVEVQGQTRTLELAGAAVVDLAMTGAEQFLSTIVNAIAIPGIAILLIVLGVQAIIGEFSQPGGFVAGIVGAIALLLGLFALGILNANWVGLAFIGLAFLLFTVELFTGASGALSLGGIIAFILGSVVLFRGTGVAIPWGAITGLTIVMVFFFTVVLAKIVRAQRQRPIAGSEMLVGQMAVARSELNPTGQVLVQGELWVAELRNAGGPAPIDARLVVTGREGLRLFVEPAPKG